MNDVDKNYDYFEKNIDDLLKKYKNKYIVVYNEQVVFSNTSMDEVLEYAKNNLEQGTYIVQKCEKPDDNIQVFYTRVR